MRLIHYSARRGLTSLSPARHGAGFATREDRRGLDRVYFYVAPVVGRDVERGCDAHMLGLPGQARYTASIDDGAVYDVNPPGAPLDPLGWLAVSDREAADRLVLAPRSPYTAIRVRCADGRDVVVSYVPVPCIEVPA